MPTQLDIYIQMLHNARLMGAIIALGTCLGVIVWLIIMAYILFRKDT